MLPGDGVFTILPELWASRASLWVEYPFPNLLCFDSNFRFDSSYLLSLSMRLHLVEPRRVYLYIKSDNFVRLGVVMLKTCNPDTLTPIMPTSII
jgi:hypothetical protein